MESDIILHELTYRFRHQLNLSGILDLILDYCPLHREEQRRLDVNLNILTESMSTWGPFETVKDFTRWNTNNRESYTDTELDQIIIYGVYIYSCAYDPSNKSFTIPFSLGTLRTFSTLRMLLLQFMTQLNRKLTPEEIKFYRTHIGPTCHPDYLLVKDQDTLHHAIGTDILFQGPMRLDHTTRKCLFSWGV